MHISTRYTELVGIEHPVVQDGLGLSPTAKLAAAVSEAGGLGTVSIPAVSADLELTARQFRAQIDEAGRLTSKPLAVNIPVGTDSSGTVLPFSEVLLTTLFAARQDDPQLARQFKVVTTSAGSPRPFTRRIKAEGLIHQHKVGTTAQAVKARDCGVDAILASGYEMGGHTNPMRVHTFVLGPNVVDAVPEIPIVLSGGVRDGRGLAAALLLGADAVAMGTRFVTTVENSDWHPDFLAAVVAMREGDDVAFAGNYGPCRGLRNAATVPLSTDAASGHGDLEMIDAKLEDMRRAQDEGDVKSGVVLAGQVASGITGIVRVSDLVPGMVAEAAEALSRVRSRVRD
jgi:enoyl-[acyl-carrier protein] reductase II